MCVLVIKDKVGAVYHNVPLSMIRRGQVVSIFLGPAKPSRCYGKNEKTEFQVDNANRFVF